MRFLLFRRLQPVVVHVLAEEELDPAVAPGTEIVDIEEPAGPALMVEGTALERYRARFQQFVQGLSGACARHRVPYVQIPSSAPLERIVAACAGAGLFDLHG